MSVRWLELQSMSDSGIQLSRRQLVQAGSLGLVGLSLPRLLQADTASIAPRAKSCILFFMEGGPAHQDLWDMKPEAPVEYRGEFKPIAPTDYEPANVLRTNRLLIPEHGVEITRAVYDSHNLDPGYTFEIKRQVVWKTLNAKST